MSHERRRPWRPKDLLRLDTFYNRICHNHVSLPERGGDGQVMVKEHHESEAYRAAINVLSDLPWDMRIVMTLKHFCDIHMSNTEIGLAAGTDAKAVTRLQVAALRRLRKREAYREFLHLLSPRRGWPLQKQETPAEILDHRQYQMYLDTNVGCPFCGRHEDATVEGGPVDIQGPIAVQECWCLDCGKHWNASFRLEGIGGD